MRPSRGDSKPCDREGCPGTMQYARPAERSSASVTRADDALRWICSDDAGHVRFASGITGDGAHATRLRQVS